MEENNLPPSQNSSSESEGVSESKDSSENHLENEVVTNTPQSSTSSSTVSSPFFSVTPSTPEAREYILGEDEHLTQMDLIPDNYYLALEPKSVGDGTESSHNTEEVMELNRMVQRRLVEQILKKKGKKIKKSDEKKRKKLIKKMKEQFSNSVKGRSTPDLKNSRIQDFEKYKARRENFMRQSLSTWRIKIIPNFDKVKYSQTTIKLWKKGLPPSIRGILWKLSVGNENRINRPLFDILRNQKLSEKTTKVEETLQLIELDLERTFPSLQFFQKTGPYYQPFLEVLECWVKFRPDVGYIQGMSYLVAMMLLNMEAYDAFVMLSNLMTSRKFHFFQIFSMKRENMEQYSNVLRVLMREKIPELHRHFEKLQITVEVFVIDWFMTLFSKSFPLDIATHFWDLYLLPFEYSPSLKKSKKRNEGGGELFLYKATLGILLFYFPKLMTLEYDECMQFLSHVNEYVTETDKFELMKSINLIKLTDRQLKKSQREVAIAQKIRTKKENKRLQKNKKRLEEFKKKNRGMKAHQKSKSYDPVFHNIKMEEDVRGRSRSVESPDAKKSKKMKNLSPRKFISNFKMKKKMKKKKKGEQQQEQQDKQQHQPNEKKTQNIHRNIVIKKGKSMKTQNTHRNVVIKKGKSEKKLIRIVSEHEKTENTVPPETRIHSQDNQLENSEKNEEMLESKKKKNKKEGSKKPPSKKRNEILEMKNSIKRRIKITKRNGKN